MMLTSGTLCEHITSNPGGIHVALKPFQTEIKVYDQLLEWTMVHPSMWYTSRVFLHIVYKYTNRASPIVSGRSPALIFFNLFIFSFSDVFLQFCDFFSRFIGIDVRRHTKFQLSMSPGRCATLISVSESVSQWVIKWFEWTLYIR